jgi:hypothetical protein
MSMLQFFVATIGMLLPQGNATNIMVRGKRLMPQNKSCRHRLLPQLTIATKDDVQRNKFCWYRLLPQMFIATSS